MTPPKRPMAASPTGGAASGPAKPDPRRPLDGLPQYRSKVQDSPRSVFGASASGRAKPDPRRLLEEGRLFHAARVGLCASHG